MSQKICVCGHGIWDHHPETEEGACVHFDGCESFRKRIISVVHHGFDTCPKYCGCHNDEVLNPPDADYLSDKEKAALVSLVVLTDEEFNRVMHQYAIARELSQETLR